MSTLSNKASDFRTHHSRHCFFAMKVMYVSTGMFSLSSAPSLTPQEDHECGVAWGVNEVTNCFAVDIQRSTIHSCHLHLANHVLLLLNEGTELTYLVPCCFRFRRPT